MSAHERRAFSMQVTLLYVFLYGFDGKLGIFISFTKKKRSKDKTAGKLF